MRSVLILLLPSGKMDTENAEAIVALGYPTVEPILPDLIDWIRDFNWPVAKILHPFLATIGAPLAPYIREVLDTKDEIWKYWVIYCIVSDSTELAEVLKPELQRIASLPTIAEQREGLDVQARNVLERFS